MKYIKSVSGFTLVELIVVITIVGILSTVGFISYSGYLTGARDSNRYSQMTKLSDFLQVYAATKSLPLPDEYVEIRSGTETIAYQGYVGSDVLEVIDYTNGGKDPKDDTFFTYMLSRDRKALQLLAFMEESVAQAPGFTQTYAADYTNRYPVSYGQKLGVLTDTTNTPIQELSSLTGSLDISNVSLTLKSFLSNDQYVEGTGTDFADLSTLIPQRGKFWMVEENRFLYTKGIECYNSENIGKIGEEDWGECAGMLIVDNSLLSSAGSSIFGGNESFSLTGPDDIEYTFADSEKNIFTGQVTQLHLLFNGTNFNEDINYWNIKNVVSINRLFENNAYFNQSLDNWDISNVAFFVRLFDGASSFNQDISSWDTSSVTNMYGLFWGASSFNQDISSWCVSNILTKPTYFDSGAGFSGNNTLQPQWGTCP